MLDVIAMCAQLEQRKWPPAYGMYEAYALYDRTVLLAYT